MKLVLNIAIAAGLTVGFVGLGTTAVSALPLLDGKVAAQDVTQSPKAETVWYRCGYRRCGYRGYYRAYRPYYGYGYYRPYYYRPHIGIGIGGVGIGLY